MNSNRRSQLKAAQALVKKVHGIVDGVKDKEQQSYDNLPRALQASPAGYAIEEALEALEVAAGAITELADALEAVVGSPA